MSVFSYREIEAKPHHERDKISGSRAKYREGRKETAVKVYTINQESCYLLILGVPAVGAKEELQSLCEQYGEVDVSPLDEYPCEQFTEVYLAAYHWFPAARTAKKHLDDKSFFGGTLHVCYAPEFETVDETRKKLRERRLYVRNRSNKDLSTQKNQPGGRSTQRKPPPSSFSKPIESSVKMTEVNACQPVTYIWAGKEYTVYPTSSAANADPGTSSQPCKMTTAEQLIPRSVARTLKRSSQQVLSQSGPAFSRPQQEQQTHWNSNSDIPLKKRR